MMHEVLIICEGHTEREFCKAVVAQSLHSKGVSLSGTLVGKPHKKRGGISPWPVYRQEILRLARERDDRSVGVLVDYYAMPSSWPGRPTAPGKALADRAKHIEDELCIDLNSELGDRFIPCVQLHEFESLLFVDTEATSLTIAAGSGLTTHDYLADQLNKIRSECNNNVEAINDSPTTAPSKRLIKLCPSYDKVAWGVLSAKEAGIDTLRDGCQWLDRWLNALESLGEV